MKKVDNVKLVKEICYKRLKEKYKVFIPIEARQRLTKEMRYLKKYGMISDFLNLSHIAEYSRLLGAPCMERGISGVSLAAYLMGFSEVNPLKPHYYCPQCGYNEALRDSEVPSGFDLISVYQSKRECPFCHTKMTGDGHNISFDYMESGIYRDHRYFIDVSNDIIDELVKYVSMQNPRADKNMKTVIKVNATPMMTMIHRLSVATGEYPSDRCHDGFDFFSFFIDGEYRTIPCVKPLTAEIVENGCPASFSAVMDMYRKVYAMFYPGADTPYPEDYLKKAITEEIIQVFRLIWYKREFPEAFDRISKEI